MANFTGRALARRSRAGATVLTALAITLAAFIGGGSAAQAADATQFNDVPRDAKFYTEVTWLADQQVTNGYRDGGFHPKESVSREAFAAFLYRLAGKPSVSLPSKSPFKDVPKSAKFYKEIVWLSKTGITTGWSDGTFRPKDKITREAIAAFLYRFDDRPSFKAPKKSPFKDMTTSSKFYKEVTWLAKSGITNGYSDGTFRPKINVSREAIAAFLYRGDTVATGDGTHKVGSAIKPGTYTAVAAGSKRNELFCAWSRRSDNTNDYDGLLSANSIVEGRAIITIKAGDKYFRTYGCSGWTPLRKTSPNATSVGDGMHAVGYHMKAGTYSAPGGESCYWERMSDFTDGLRSIIDNDFGVSNGITVTINPGEGFESRSCGTWKRVGA